jgi:hypothetical protein
MDSLLRWDVALIALPLQLVMGLMARAALHPDTLSRGLDMTFLAFHVGVPDMVEGQLPQLRLLPDR